MEIPDLIDHHREIDSMIVTSNMGADFNEFLSSTNWNFLEDHDNFASICSLDLYPDTFNQNSSFEVPQPQVEQRIINMNSNQLNMTSVSSLDTLLLSQALSSVDNLLSEAPVIDNVILHNNLSSETFLSKQNQAKLSNPPMNQNQSTSVTPVLHLTDANSNTLLASGGMPLGLIKSGQIELLSQPREFYRPRTQNESKNSSHYIRCEDKAPHDYPTIKVPQEWLLQSNVNYVQVALVDIYKDPHPYSLDHKQSEKFFQDGAAIVKGNEANIVYFRLTNDDFLHGFKPFYIELIKSKQDDNITKKLIRLKNLEQSMLCFTRFYADEQGMLTKDLESQVYSSVMTESYGEVTVEHVSPRYSPMCGQELMFISLKGRFIKDDITVFISETQHGWCQQVTKISINGTFVYFSIPAFPHSQVPRIHATVSIYFKKQLIERTYFLYSRLLDQEMQIKKSDLDASAISNNINHLNINTRTATGSIPSLTKSKPKTKSPKRLNS